MYWRDEIDARREKMDRTGQPFFEQTLALFDAVNSLRLDELRELVDDDYGIMDVDPAGETVVIESKAEWDEYMVRNFAAMEAAGARLETEVLKLLGEGRSAKQIAGELYRSEDTVRNHIRAIKHALDARSQLEAVARARKLGLLSD
jgi:DNA-binding NarL/FixJ family response regulator